MHGEFPNNKKKTFWWGDGCRWLTNKVYPILYIIMMRRRASWPKLMAFLTLHALYSCPHFGKTHVTFFSKMIFLIINIILIACEKKSVKHCLSICHCNKLPPSFAEDLSVCNLHFEDQLFFTICKCANVRRNPDRFWHILMNRKRLG